MSKPTVCCILLTRDRPEMAARAVCCFREQTYDPAGRYLVILDSGDASWYDPASDAENEVHVSLAEFQFKKSPATIGTLRNHANGMTKCGCAIAHWDDDDYSHPNRLAEQVALLQSSGADAVGYNSMLFWDTRKSFTSKDGEDGCVLRPLNQAWLYRAVNPQHILGTSLLYWRSTWERQAFDDIPTAEDTRWVAKLGKKAVGVSSLHSREMDINTKFAPGQIVDVTTPYEPRMIASVHGGNSSGYAPEKDRASTKRAPEWDSYCRKVMQL